MFYCEECRKKNEWPLSLHRSYGSCEICNKCSDCYDVKSEHLGTPPDLQHGREPEKVKPLAQYLDEYIEHEAELGNINISCQGIRFVAANYDTWQGLLEQALDAYESTEQVKIRIEPA